MNPETDLDFKDRCVAQIGDLYVLIRELEKRVRNLEANHELQQRIGLSISPYFDHLNQ